MVKIRVSIVPSISQIVVTTIAKAREIMIEYFNVCFVRFYCFAPTFKAIREAKALPKAMADNIKNPINFSTTPKEA